MKALCWFGKHDVRLQQTEDPEILNPTDAIVRVTAASICGSDLHLYEGLIPSIERGDILGHEFMGEVIEVGPEVTRLRPGDRVVVPCSVACGRCAYCRTERHSLCDNSNPNAWKAEELYGFSPAGLFGWSRSMGGYAGGQAEYVRVPFADVGPFKIEEGVSDESVLFLGDILPAAYMAVESCNLKPGQVVAIWGCGPVGQLAIECAILLGAQKVIAIDRIDKRLQLARDAGADTIDPRDVDVLEAIRERTGGRGADVCIDAVGMDIDVLSEAIMACRKGGTVSLAGVHGDRADDVPLGAAFNKALTVKMGPAPVHRCMKLLFGHVAEGRLKPSRIITHRLPLDEAPSAYDLFFRKRDDCVKVVLRP
jgi:threonine dehydrogenase-like Zn-dependent dehydrogenase